jgi:hypothetical protein
MALEQSQLHRPSDVAAQAFINQLGAKHGQAPNGSDANSCCVPSQKKWMPSLQDQSYCVSFAPDPALEVVFY